MRRFSSIFACALLAAALAPALASAAGAPAPWIVTFEPGTGSVDAETGARERARGFRASLRFRHAMRGFAARLTADQVAALRADPEVAAVTPDRPRRIAGGPLASGDSLPAGVRRVGASTPERVRGAATSSVAVLDTGIELAHPDLAAAAGVDCTGTGSSNDDHGHGTHVAGTIGARNDGRGVVGVAPGTTVRAVKVLDAAGSGSDSTVICGLDWVTANAGPLNVRVVNLSLGGGGIRSTCGDRQDPLHEAVCRTVAAGVTVVVAAGNDGRDLGGTSPAVPAWYPEVLTVTAMSDGDGVPGGLQAPTCTSGHGDDVSAGFSNFASAEADAAHTMAAPGVCVRSTYTGGRTATSSGTSMAAPHVAGLAALCLGEDGAAGPCAGMTPAQIATRLRDEAAQAAALGRGFLGDPLTPRSGRWYGSLGHAVPGAAPDAASSAPAAPAPDRAPVAQDAGAADAAPASTRSCRVHVHARRHVHRRSHRHRGAARRHVHRRVHVHRVAHLHCG